MAHKHALATLQSGSTVPTNNPTRHHNQRVFTTAPCPRFYAEYHGCQRRGNSARVPATQQQQQPASPLEARARSRDVPTAAYVTHYGAHSLNPKTRALPHFSLFYQKGLSTIEMTTKVKTHSLVMNLATISKFVVAPTYYNLDRRTKFSFSLK